MDIEDYLISPEGLDFEKLFADWQVFLTENFSVWLINKFGDMFVIYDDKTIHMLDTGGATISQVAENQDDFISKLENSENASDWLLIDLVDEMKLRSAELGKNECFSFINPPILGGAYEPENIKASDIYVHYSVAGQIATQTKDLPEGTEININLREDS